jgi:hypothetical protein
LRRSWRRRDIREWRDIRGLAAVATHGPDPG